MRIQCLQRVFIGGAQYGFSIYELEVYGLALQIAHSFKRSMLMVHLFLALTLKPTVMFMT